MELRKIHLREIVFELYTALTQFAQRKASSAEWQNLWSNQRFAAQALSNQAVLR
jgi:hypothetical protein